MSGWSRLGCAVWGWEKGIVIAAVSKRLGNVCDTKCIEETDDSLQEDSLTYAAVWEDICHVLIEANVVMFKRLY